jgi:hypothetical protein
MLSVFIVFVFSTAATLHAQTPREAVVDLKATPSESPPTITLSWTQQLQGNITAQKIYRRLKGDAAWPATPLATLSNTATSYSDTSVSVGIEYEYWMQRSINLASGVARGYISAGIKVPETHERGKLLLLVDSTMVTALAPEITELKEDLAADGWTVQQISAPRTGTATSTKALIKSAYDADPVNVKMLYLLGHVPVPYSGQIAPDGHGDHGGAWPADGYYGDMDGTWTDSTVNATYASSTRNHNIPGDGKFDQNQLPSPVELQIGRVDMHGLNRSPAIISTAMETTLLRRYLKKAHDFRQKRGAYANIPRRSLIRDGFGWFGGEAFAAQAWAGAYTNIGQSPEAPIDEAPVDEWFSPSYAGGQTYLWGHGNGSGSLEAAQSVGTSTDFGHKPSRVVFPSMFGSWHGDWDSDNNLMRSVIAGNATGDSLALCCFWQGRPNWFMHQLGMGETLGSMARLSMNANLAGSPNYLPPGSSTRSIHLGLMGDPALRIHAVQPTQGLAAQSASSQVTLTWNASTEPGADGYHVYRAASSIGPFTRLTTTPIITTTYTDSAVTAGQSYSYLVRTRKLESVPGGSYYNLSVGSQLNVTARSGAALPNNPSDLIIVSQSSAGNPQLTWQDNSTDETSFRVERKLTATGSWGLRTALAPNTTSFTDTGSFTAGSVYFYRIVATSASGNPTPSNTVSFEASAGFIEFPSRWIKVNKTAGTASITVTRFGGGSGAITVTATTANSSAIAGTHFTHTSGSISWANGEVGNKTFTVPITNSGTPQQVRQFIVNLSSPSGGARLGVFSSTAVAIEDPTATLEAPWSQTLLGSVTDSSPAGSAEGKIGSSTIGGSFGSNDNGRFIYQQHTGDGSLTAYIHVNLPTSSWAARMSLVVRDSLNSYTSNLAGVASGGWGTRFIRKQNGFPSEDTKFSALVTPCWVRITRTNATFQAEQSADGNTWTPVGQITNTAMPATAYWGIFDFGEDAATTTDYKADYNLGTYSNVSFSTGVPLPLAPDGLVMVPNTNPTSVGIQWNTKSFSAGYRIERRTEGGAFIQVADLAPGTASTQTYTNTGLALDTAYEYRVIAYNSSGEAASAAAGWVTSGADLIVTRTTDDPGGADAAIRNQTPDAALGAQNRLTVSGYNPIGGAPDDIAKTYLRFDMGNLPGPVVSAKLKLSFMETRLFAQAFFYQMYFYLLKDDASDAWNENTITWNNAPQNDSEVGLLQPFAYAGSYSIGNPSQIPAVGNQISVSLMNLTAANIGANNLLTIVALQDDNAAQADWASREHTTYAPPTLELTIANPIPKRPGFLTVTPGGGGNALSWIDFATNETGFQIERRAANGEWISLATLASNNTSHTDATALPGVIYEYRVRSTGSAGNSAWATTSSLLTNGALTVNQPVSSADGITVSPVDASPGNSY